jgi:hypothetical protein
LAQFAHCFNADRYEFRRNFRKFELFDALAEMGTDHLSRPYDGFSHAADLVDHVALSMKITHGIVDKSKEFINIIFAPFDPGERCPNFADPLKHFVKVDRRSDESLQKSLCFVKVPFGTVS